MEYYYEEDYPDCYGEEINYTKQPACLTCVWKRSCGSIIEESKRNGEDFEYNLDNQ